MIIGLNLASFPKRCLSEVMMLALHYICPLIAQKLTINYFANNLNTRGRFFCEDELKYCNIKNLEDFLWSFVLCVFCSVLC